MNIKTRIALTAVVFLSLFYLPSCGKKGSGPFLEKDHLSIISPHPSAVIAEFESAFRRHYQKKFNRDVEFEWLDIGGTSDDMKFIESEFKKNPKGIKVDMFWGGGTSPYLTFKKKGFFETYKPSDDILKMIPRKISGLPAYDSDYQWFGSALTSFGFICNKALLDLKKMSPPLTWKELGDPRFAGVIASGDPRHSGSTYTIYSIILQAYGWEKGWASLMRMGANVRNFTAHVSDALKEVTTGDSICGLTIDFYAWAKIDELGEDKLSFTLPAGLTAIDADSMAILKGAPNREVAREFISFVLSKEGQRLWLLPAGAEGGPEKKSMARLALIPSLYDELGDKSIVKLNPFRLKGYINFNEHESDALRNVVNDMIGTFVIDIKNDLNEVWKKMIAKGLSPEFLKVLDEIPVTKAKAYEYASKWDDNIFRNKIINEWHAYNRLKMGKLKRLASG